MTEIVQAAWMRSAVSLRHVANEPIVVEPKLIERVCHLLAANPPTRMLVESVSTHRVVDDFAVVVQIAENEAACVGRRAVRDSRIDQHCSWIVHMSRRLAEFVEVPAVVNAGLLAPHAARSVEVRDGIAPMREVLPMERRPERLRLRHRGRRGRQRGITRRRSGCRGLARRTAGARHEHNAAPDRDQAPKD